MKKNAVAEALLRAGIPMPPGAPFYFKGEYGYRNRMDFVFSEKGPGFRRSGKFYRFVNFEECFISNDGINSALGEVTAWFNENREKISVFDVVKKQGVLRYSTIRSSYFTEDSSVTFILNKDAPHDALEAHRGLISEFGALSGCKNILIGLVKSNSDLSAVDDAVVVKGREFLEERLGPCKFFYHTQGFFQNNSAVTMDMLFYAREKAGSGYDCLLDLFGGVGTFGIFLKDAAAEAIIADNSQTGRVCAEMNIRENNAGNVSYIHFEAVKPGELHAEFEGKKTIFILDPPRAGMHKKTMKFILTSAPERIIYISCNPVRLGEDMRALSTKYNMTDMAMFDMFPQTRHIECAVVLDKKNGLNNQAR
ncbi:MAG TPA: class I SAM-dependent RNA methyltransferase [bacterium]|nr:class I SAM-dependent RNA methyltransferase [bacterium]